MSVATTVSNIGLDRRQQCFSLRAIYSFYLIQRPRQSQREVSFIDSQIDNMHHSCISNFIVIEAVDCWSRERRDVV